MSRVQGGALPKSLSVLIGVMVAPSPDLQPDAGSTTQCITLVTP